MVLPARRSGEQAGRGRSVGGADHLTRDPHGPPDIWHDSIVNDSDIDRPRQSISTADRLAALPEPAALLFDLDGTLVDTVHLRVEAWLRAFRGIGIEAEPSFLGQYMGSDGRWLAGDVAAHYGRKLNWDQRDELDRISGDNFSELNHNPRPLPGATELLTALEATTRVAYAIATASQPGQVGASVEALRLPSPPRVTDGSHVEHAKPEPDLLLESARQLGVAPERCWYVGDSKWDMMAGVRAGMIAVAVTTGATTVRTLIEAGASVALPVLEVLHGELRRRGLAE
jgi:HAD superfamily hydrolase (TIGR01509 family)